MHCPNSVNISPLSAVSNGYIQDMMENNSKPFRKSQRTMKEKKLKKKLTCRCYSDRRHDGYCSDPHCSDLCGCLWPVRVLAQQQLWKCSTKKSRLMAAAVNGTNRAAKTLTFHRAAPFHSTHKRHHRHLGNPRIPVKFGKMRHANQLYASWAWVGNFENIKCSAFCLCRHFTIHTYNKSIAIFDQNVAGTAVFLEETF